MKIICVALLSCGVLFAQTPTPPSILEPLVLSKEDSLQLEVFQLKVQIIRMEAAEKYNVLQPEVNAYVAKVQSAHPNAKYRFDANSLSWSPIPQPAVKPEEKKK